jgi:hypothetical protein
MSIACKTQMHNPPPQPQSNPFCKASFKAHHQLSLILASVPMTNGLKDTRPYPTT